MEAKAFQERQRRVLTFRERLVRDLKKESKGLVDASLVRRAETIPPAFVANDAEWRMFGATGYPITGMGIIASANVIDARVIRSNPTVGIGAIG
jgi:hypothetical protein